MLSSSSRYPTYIFGRVNIIGGMVMKNDGQMLQSVNNKNKVLILHIVLFTMLLYIL